MPFPSAFYCSQLDGQVHRRAMFTEAVVGVVAVTSNPTCISWRGSSSRIHQSLQGGSPLTLSLGVEFMGPNQPTNSRAIRHS